MEPSNNEIDNVIIEEKRPIFILSQIHNINILSYYKDISCLVLGSACGILQLHAIEGLLFFIITNILSSWLYQIFIIKNGNVNNSKSKDRMEFKITDFYENPIQDIYLSNFGRHIATFTMMWCLLDALVSY